MSITVYIVSATLVFGFSGLLAMANKTTKTQLRGLIASSSASLTHCEFYHIDGASRKLYIVFRRLNII
jgi:hypothetical protein